MKIEGTELEHFDDDAVCLDFYLGEHSEDKEKWAKRVWDNCKLYKENGGLDLEGNKLSRVYKRDAKDLWEEKKRRRRAAFVKHCTGEECDPELLKPENIKRDLKEKKECKWPKSHSTAEILRMKGDPKIKYKTATERHREEEEKHRKIQLEIEEERMNKVSKLKKTFDDETIAIIYPEGEKYLGSKSNGIVSAGRK
jgi:hypothetical protein